MNREDRKCRKSGEIRKRVIWKYRRQKTLPDKMVMSARAAIAPVNTVSLEWRIDIITAMNQVLSPGNGNFIFFQKKKIYFQNVCDFFFWKYRFFNLHTELRNDDNRQRSKESVIKRDVDVVLKIKILVFFLIKSPITTRIAVECNIVFRVFQEKWLNYRNFKSRL